MPSNSPLSNSELEEGSRSCSEWGEWESGDLGGVRGEEWGEEGGSELERGIWSKESMGEKVDCEETLGDLTKCFIWKRLRMGEAVKRRWRYGEQCSSGGGEWGSSKGLV